MFDSSAYCARRFVCINFQSEFFPFCARSVLLILNKIKSILLCLINLTGLIWLAVEMIGALWTYSRRATRAVTIIMLFSGVLIFPVESC